MADYLTNTTELTAVADAIREKTGENGDLIYPNGFVNAIEGISSGGAETTTVSFFNVNTFMPMNIYYTDENMVVQHTTDGYLMNVQMPIGTLIYCQGNYGPALSQDNIGVTSVYVEATGRTINAIYQVTG